MSSAALDAALEEARGLVVADLRAQLKSRGAPTAGKKGELLERLAELLRAEHAASNTENETAAAPTVEADGEGEKGAGERPADVVKTKEPVMVVDAKAAAVAEPGRQSSATDVNDESPRSQQQHQQHWQQRKEEDGDREEEQEESYYMTRHVRIDNFMRPLNVRALREWLENVSDCSIPESAMWVNSIKTHCYVDFPTPEQAAVCARRVTGQSFPVGTKNVLEANFTNVSVSAAPQSKEAMLRPGAWRTEKAPQKREAAKRVQTTEIEHSESHDPDNIELKRRKLVTKTVDAAAGGGGSVIRSGMGGLNMFKKAAAASVSNATTPRGQAAPSAAPFAIAAVTATSPTAAATAGASPTAFGAPSLGQAQGRSGGGSGDAGFGVEYVTTYFPHLTWSKAPGVEVERRLKARLSKS